MVAFLVRPASPARTRFWFCLSLICAAIFGLLALRIALGSAYVVQDDARQHVFWLERLLNPALFPQDLIADYFQSVAPMGYKSVYQVFALIGWHPLVVAKFLPVLLGLITTAYCFGVTIQILPVPLAGFLASLLLNQNLVMADDLWSATPRAFLYPLFLAFLYYFLKRSLWPCVGAIALQGLFYPQVMFISVGILALSLVEWRKNWPRLSSRPQDYRFCGAGLVAAVLVLGIYFLFGGTEFGPAIKAAQARQMPEFWDTGRGSFFSHDILRFWTFAGRSGLLSHPEQLLKPPLILVGLLLPWLGQQPARFPLGQRLTASWRVLPWILLSSVGLFGAAHLLIFRLHHPSRYTQHSFRILLAIAAGITLTLLLDGLHLWATQRPQRRNSAIAIAAILGLLLAVYPLTVRLNGNPLLKWFVPTYLFKGYMVGQQPALYEFFAQQPPDVVIASLAPEANNIPTFAQRSILAGREYAIPYHVGYYQQFRARAIAQLQAHYSPDLEIVRRFTQQYRITFWLLDDAAFQPDYLRDKDWLQQYQPTVTEASVRARSPQKSVLELAIPRCTVFQAPGLRVLAAQCVQQK
jgi:hypothetical protein